MRRVQVSAQYLIHWPKCCACCMGPAERTVEASAARVTGVKVVRREEKGWLIPYCRGCVNHHKLSERINARSSPGDDWELSNAAFIKVGGACLLLLAMMFLVGMLLPFAPGAKLPFGWSGAQFYVGCLTVASFSLAGGIGLLTWAAYITGQEAAEASERQDKESKRMAGLRTALNQCFTDDCASKGPAVIYEGWYGTLHTFEFSSDAYAEAFCRANAGKIV